MAKWFWYLKYLYISLVNSGFLSYFFTLNEKKDHNPNINLNFTFSSISKNLDFTLMLTGLFRQHFHMFCSKIYPLFSDMMMLSSPAHLIQNICNELLDASDTTPLYTGEYIVIKWSSWAVVYWPNHCQG